MVKNILTGLFLIATLALAALIVFLVRTGIIYGAASITIFETIVSSLVLIGMGMAYLLWRPRRIPPVGGGTRVPPGGGTSDGPDPRADSLLSRGSLLVATVAIILSLLSFLAPGTPPDISVESCPGAHTWKSPYVAITLNGVGNNSRSGPSRSFPPNGTISREVLDRLLRILPR